MEKGRVERGGEGQNGGTVKRAERREDGEEENEGQWRGPKRRAAGRTERRDDGEEQNEGQRRGAKQRSGGRNAEEKKCGRKERQPRFSKRTAAVRDRAKLMQALQNI